MAVRPPTNQIFRITYGHAQIVSVATERTHPVERTFSCVLDAVKYAQRPWRHNAQKHGLT